MRREEITCVASRRCDPAMTYNKYLTDQAIFRSYWRHSRPCPKCGKRLMVNGKEFRCVYCEYVEEY